MIVLLDFFPEAGEAHMLRTRNAYISSAASGLVEFFIRASSREGIRTLGHRIVARHHESLNVALRQDGDCKRMAT
jgi:hypothetical protein